MSMSTPSSVEQQVVDTCLRSMACAVTLNEGSGVLEEPNGLQSGSQLAGLMSSSCGAIGHFNSDHGNQNGSSSNNSNNGDRCWTFPCYSLKHNQTSNNSSNSSNSNGHRDIQDRTSLERAATNCLAQPLHASKAELRMIPAFIIRNIHDTFQSLVNSRLRSYLLVLSKQTSTRDPVQREATRKIVQILMSALKDTSPTNIPKLIQPTTIVNRFESDGALLCVAGQGFIAPVSQEISMDIRIMGGESMTIRARTSGNLLGSFDPQQLNPCYGLLSHVSLTMDMEPFLASLTLQVKLAVRNAVRKVSQLCLLPEPDMVIPDSTSLNDSNFGMTVSSSSSSNVIHDNSGSSRDGSSRYYANNNAAINSNINRNNVIDTTSIHHTNNIINSSNHTPTNNNNNNNDSTDMDDNNMSCSSLDIAFLQKDPPAPPSAKAVHSTFKTDVAGMHPIPLVDAMSNAIRTSGNNSASLSLMADSGMMLGSDSSVKTGWLLDEPDSFDVNNMSFSSMGDMPLHDAVSTPQGKNNHDEHAV